jgi:mRNA interferase MazF
VNRGDVYRIRPVPRAGHEQQGARFGVVVQTDALLRLSTVLVAPTSRSAAAASFRPRVTVAGETTVVLVDQVTAIDVARLGRKVGRLDTDETWALDDALRTVLAL